MNAARGIAAAALLIGSSMVLAAPATATADRCYEQIVDQPAHDDTVTTREAYDEQVIDQPAQEAIDGAWWNFSPNKQQGPFDGPPTFPTDDRGTWQGPHTNGGPDGEGTYQNGNGHGSWFHRDADVAAVPATYKWVSHPAVTELVHHAATYKDVEVACAEVPPVVTDPVDPVDPVDPTEPVDEPVDEPTPDPTIDPTTEPVDEPTSEPQDEAAQVTDATDKVAPTVVHASAVLPDTGAPSSLYLGAGVLLLLAGVGVTVASRKRDVA